MRFRKRRRGRRKATSPAQLLYSSTLLISLFTLGAFAASASSPVNNTDLTGTTRQLYKRQLVGDSQYSATSQVTFASEDHDLEQRQQSHHSNHYEEPLALASSEDAQQDGQQARQNRGNRILYACEEKRLEIDCQSGESIQLIRANYGRFSIQICNEHGQLDWKVNCMSSDSFDIITRSCQAKQSCQLLASNEIFGDACPGTQKYLEVHYSCVPANRTQQPSEQSPQQKVNQIKPATIKTGNNVIQPQQFGEAATTASNSEISALQQQQIVTRPPWMGPVTPISSPKQLPNWITDVSLNSYGVGASRAAAAAAATQTPVASDSPSTPLESGPARRPRCPEVVWRSVHWPETEAGQLAQRPCPAHTFPSAVGMPAAASLLCQASGQWAERSHIPGRCHSVWLRNLTQRLDTGDSPLSILSELVHRTQPGDQQLALSQQQQQRTGSGSGVASWLAYATSSLTSSPSTAGQSAGAKLGRLPLFGEDLVQVGRTVGRLVDEMGELLARISDDKQRITFAREMIQLIVDLINNLLHEDHAEAWLDLASLDAAANQSGERQRVAGQLVAGLENGCVFLANALIHQQRAPTQSPDQEDFQKITEHVYVAIQSHGLDSKQTAGQRLQVTFPRQTSVLGARWMSADQRFTLNLQASAAAEADQQAGQAFGGQQQLKIVGVMLRGLGVHMQPTQAVSDKSSSSDTFQPAGRSLAVNSDLVGFSIVADSTRAKVDLSAPIELVFRHVSQAIVTGGSQPPTTAAARPATGGLCASWDTTASDWSGGGCKLAASNRTHSVCACDHLTTFGLLSELDQSLSADQPAAPTTSGPAEQHLGRFARVHLDNVEGELSLLDGQTSRAIHMARLLDGGLFASGQTGARSAAYASCCLSGLLLALLLAAAAYNRAHTRRLLGSLPAEPPPALLVANYHSQQPLDRMLQPSGAHSIETSTTNGASPPTSYSSGQATSVDLLAGAATSKPEQANILGHDDELNGFYSLIGAQSSQYGAPSALAKPCNQLAASQRHLAAGSHRKTDSFAQVALVPVHLIVQLLMLQLLMLLMIESQNLLAWNSQQARRSFMQSSLALLSFSQFSGGLSTPPSPLAQHSDQLDPIGFVTWLAVFAVYYLTSTLVCWLLARLVQLNGRLLDLGDLLAPAKPFQSVQTISGGAIYTQQQPPVNRYGHCQLHQNGAQQASSSPSLSNFSSLLAGDLAGQAARQQLGGRLDHLESRQPKEQALYMRQSLARSARQLQYRAGSRADISGCPLSRCLVRVASNSQLACLVVHLGPLLTACSLVWLTYERAQLINLFAFTGSWISQLAYWPLALNVAWNFPLALHLYCLPSICLALGVLALAMLRRQFGRIYKSQTATSQFGPGGPKRPDAHHQLEGESALVAEAKGQNGHQQRHRSGGHSAIELAVESKRAKSACLTLLALLALNSICWISFFIHCHQAVSEAGQSSTAGGHLILTFAASNLLISLLICCSHRRQLKRACQLLGLARFVASLGGPCCQLAEAAKSSPASTSSVSSSSYYNNNGAHVHHAADVQQQPMHYGTGKSIKISSAASQQSLFAISRSRPIGAGGGGAGPNGVLAEIAQPTYDANQAYGLQQQQQQVVHLNHNYPTMANQHLYQQLAAANSQQHIYDSTTNLSGAADLAEQQKQRQLNAFHLMQQNQRQQQFNQQEPMIHYTLGRPFNGSQFHLSHQPQHGFQGAGNMTLKPMPASLQQQQPPQMSFASHLQQGARSNPHEPLMCPINGAKTHSASSSGRQPQFGQPTQVQQQQQISASASSSSASSSSNAPSGEADGPLVALAQTTTAAANKRRHEFSIASASQSTSPATFGPTHCNANTNNNHQINNSQQATEHRPSNNNNHHDNQSFVEVIGHGGNSADHCFGANQQQLGAAGKPIKHNNCNQAGQNYADALKAAMAQEANQQHFRRTNSTAMRQQQHQQQQPPLPHRSFASSSAMIDAQLDHQSRPLSFGPADMLADDNNTYDVANCGR